MSTKAIVEWLRTRGPLALMRVKGVPGTDAAIAADFYAAHIAATWPDAPRETPGPTREAWFLVHPSGWPRAYAGENQPDPAAITAGWTVERYVAGAPRETGERGEVRELRELAATLLLRAACAALRALSRSGEEPGSGAGEGGDRG